jgi:hypothetical protein
VEYEACAFDLVAFSQLYYMNEYECIGCEIFYRTKRKAKVGKPCPNHRCPKGHPPLEFVGYTRKYWRNKLIKTVGLVSGVSTVAGGVIYYDVGGLGATTSNVVITISFQIIIAIILLSLAAFSMQIIRKSFLQELLFRQRGLLRTFAILAVFLASPIVAFIFNRPFDTYEVIQTILLGIVANVISKQVEKYLTWRERKEGS